MPEDNSERTHNIPAVLILTVGNIYRCDDGIGPYIAGKVKNTGIILLNAGDKPESIIDKAIDICPELTLIIDSADFSGKHGEIRVLSYDSMPENIISTHSFPIKAIAGILMRETGSRIVFIGIQPEKICFGKNITAGVKAAGDYLVQLINGSSPGEILNKLKVF